MKQRYKNLFPTRTTAKQLKYALIDFQDSYIDIYDHDLIYESSRMINIQDSLTITRTIKKIATLKSADKLLSMNINKISHTILTSVPPRLIIDITINPHLWYLDVWLPNITYKAGHKTVYQLNPYVELFLYKIIEFKIATKRDKLALFFGGGIIRVRKFLDKTSLNDSEYLNDSEQKILESSPHVQKYYILKEFSESLWQSAKDDQFKKKYNDFLRLPEKNYRSLVKYVSSLVDLYPKLLVVKVELAAYMDMKLPNTDDPNNLIRKKVLASLDKMYEYRKEFITHFLYKTPLGQHCVGYIMKLFYSLERGYYFHTLIFFDGSISIEGNQISQEIATQWDTAANKNGIFYYCNDPNKDDSYRLCKIGMLDRHNQSSLKQMHQSIIYLTQIDRYFRIKVDSEKMNRKKDDKKNRVLFKGTIKKPKKRALSISKN